MNTRKIYKRVYDNHLNKDGTEKENVYLGEFEVLQQIYGDENEYSEMFLGRNVETGVVYLIDGVEVSGVNGGTRYSYTEIKAELLQAQASEPVANKSSYDYKLLAMELAAQEHDDIHELIWEGFPPEPWGEVWQKYEGDAKNLIAMVSKYTSPPNTPYDIGKSYAQLADRLQAKLDKAREALQLVNNGAKTQGAHTGMSWQQVADITEQAIKDTQ